MKEYIEETNYFNHHKTLQSIKNRRRIFAFQQLDAKPKLNLSTNAIFKTGGCFKIKGEYINQDQYFDQAFKTNIILAKKLETIENRK